MPNITFRRMKDFRALHDGSCAGKYLVCHFPGADAPGYEDTSPTEPKKDRRSSVKSGDE